MYRRGQQLRWHDSDVLVLDDDGGEYVPVWVYSLKEAKLAPRTVLRQLACDDVLAEARRVLEYARVYVGMEGTEEEHRDLLEVLALLGGKP